MRIGRSADKCLDDNIDYSYEIQICFLLIHKSSQSFRFPPRLLLLISNFLLECWIIKDNWSGIFTFSISCNENKSAETDKRSGCELTRASRARAGRAIFLFASKWCPQILISCLNHFFSAFIISQAFLFFPFFPFTCSAVRKYPWGVLILHCWE